MSYTQFVATATCTVVDGFNLKSYLDALSERCVKEGNFVENYGEFEEKLDLDFSQYVREQGNKILIECDSEEYNGDSEVWEWLVDQFVPVMTSPFVEVKYVTFNSRSGLDCHQSYLLKDGTWIGSDEIATIIQEHLKKST